MNPLNVKWNSLLQELKLFHTQNIWRHFHIRHKKYFGKDWRNWHGYYSVTDCMTYVFLQLIVCVMLVSEPQHTQHVISSVWETCKYIQVQTYLILSRTIMNFGIWSTRTEPKQAKISWYIFLKKISGLQKLLDVFSRNCRTQKIDFGPNQIRPLGWHCNRFCWVTHNCVTTVIFGSS